MYGTIFPAITARSAVQDAAEAAAKSAARRSAIAQHAGALLADYTVGLLQSGFTELVTGGSSGGAGNAMGSASVQSAAREEVNAGNRGVYGEFAHWNLYQSFFALAGLPLPNNPNSPLAEF